LAFSWFEGVFKDMGWHLERRMATRSTLAFLYYVAGIVVLGVFLAPPAQGSPILADHLVNIRVGDGTTTPAGTGLPVTLDDYQVNYVSGVPTSVTLMQSIPLPTSTSGTPPTSGSRYLTQGGTAAGEGGLTRSLDGLYMALGGYNNTIGGLTNGSGNSGQRVVGLLNLGTGNVDTSTDYADAAVGSAIRSAYTTNGMDIWTANSTAGVRYVTAGSSTSTTLTGTGGERRVYVYPNASNNNQLYTSRQSAPVDGPATVGSPPPPTSGAQTVAALPGFPITNTDESAYDFFFADPNTLYVGDDNATFRGLQKWQFNGSSWARLYNITVTPGTTARGLKSLAGTVDSTNGNVTLFGASTDTSANALYGFTDTISNTNVANVTVNKLVDATTAFTGAAWNLRGVALNAAGGLTTTTFSPEPATTGVILTATSLMSLRRRRRRRS
jgi:hypothetical protein